MPRFTLKSMFLLVAVVALWLSTLPVYPGNNDLRNSIVLLTVVVSGLIAHCSSGRRKCFWLGFFLVLFATTWSQNIIAPEMSWVYELVRAWGISPDDYQYADINLPTGNMLLGQFVTDTIRFVTDLILATLAGFVGFYIYAQTSTAKET